MILYETTGFGFNISKYLTKNITLIDLAADFRLEKTSDYLKWYKQKHRAKNLIKKSIYSLPEINGKELNNYQIISCPGCYPTSILLPLIPLFESNLVKVKNIIMDSKSGYSGAGRGVHNKYKDKGLVIVGISLDIKEKSWKKAIINDRLDWIQVSHLKRWDDPIASIYGVNSIPQLFLLDENGVVIAKERHAVDFIPFIEKILL